MADIRDTVVQLGEAVVFSEANDNFKNLAAALNADKGVALTINQSYMSMYDVMDELRLLVKDKIDSPPSDIKPLLTEDKSMLDIVNENYYSNLANFIDNLTEVDFEPPLPSDFVSRSGITVKQFPNKAGNDPRRTGRLIVPGPSDILKSTEVQKWLANNSVLYGFVPYSDNALYYLGVDLIKSNITKAADKQEALLKIINTFVKSTTPSTQVTLTYQQVVGVSATNSLSTTSIDDLETVVDNNTTTNTGTVLELVVIDNQPVWKDIAPAYISMFNAAKADGVTLRISSGFRPAFGPSQTAKTNKGHTITLTTQETLRRDQKRWIGRSTFTGTDNDFVLKAPASSFKPATAIPGSSKHGAGLALDLNVGGRDNFQPLQEVNYTWLIKNSYKYGFVRTVASEEWHFEYLPSVAQNGPYAAIGAGDSAAKFYADLGLARGQFQV